jgi:hypothetical protein
MTSIFALGDPVVAARVTFAAVAGGCATGVDPVPPVHLARDPARYLVG